MEQLVRMSVVIGFLLVSYGHGAPVQDLEKRRESTPEILNLEQQLKKAAGEDKQYFSGTEARPMPQIDGLATDEQGEGNPANDEYEIPDDVIGEVPAGAADPEDGGKAYSELWDLVKQNPDYMEDIIQDYMSNAGRPGTHAEEPNNEDLSYSPDGQLLTGADGQSLTPDDAGVYESPLDPADYLSTSSMARDRNTPPEARTGVRSHDEDDVDDDAIPDEDEDEDEDEEEGDDDSDDDDGDDDEQDERHGSKDGKDEENNDHDDDDDDDDDDANDDDDDDDNEDEEEELGSLKDENKVSDNAGPDLSVTGQLDDIMPADTGKPSGGQKYNMWKAIGDVAIPPMM